MREELERVDEMVEYCKRQGYESYGDGCGLSNCDFIDECSYVANIMPSFSSSFPTPWTLPREWTEEDVEEVKRRIMLKEWGI